MDLQALFSKVEKAYRYDRDITISGLKYTLRLPGADNDRRVTKMQELMSISKSQEDLENAFDLVKRATIAAFLVSIDGEIFPEEITEKEEVKKRMEYLLEASEKWPQSLTDVLYSSCQDLRKSSRSDLYGKVTTTWFEKPLYEDLLETGGIKAEAGLAEVKAQDSARDKEVSGEAPKAKKAGKGAAGG